MLRNCNSSQAQRQEGHPCVLFQCSLGHMVTPPTHSFMCRNNILCPLCDESPFEFVSVAAEDLPQTEDEYGNWVIERDEVELYGREVKS